MSLVNLIQQHLGMGHSQLPVRSAPMPQKPAISMHPVQNQQYQNVQRLGAQNTVPLQARPAAPNVLQGGGPTFQSRPQNQWTQWQGGGTHNLTSSPIVNTPQAPHLPSWITQTGYHDISRQQHGQSAMDEVHNAIRMIRHPF